MERVRRLRAFWNWLPVFRVVAETEHLPTASEALRVSPASLSRTIALLEDELGVSLFDRVGRGLRLNAAGSSLLDSVRNGMRLVDEGVSGVVGQSWTGHVALWAERVYAETFLLPVVGDLHRCYPNLCPAVESSNAHSVEGRILRGQLELALTEMPLSHPQLKTESFRTIEYGIYCVPAHRLATRKSLDLKELLAEEKFVALASSSRRASQRWPVEHARTVVAVVDDVAMAAAACAQLGALVALPVVAVDALAGDRLHRLPVSIVPAATLYLVYRKPVGRHPHTEHLLEFLHASRS